MVVEVPREEGRVRERTTADLERELHMLAAVRAYLRDAEGTDMRIPTTAVDRVLDELNQTRTTRPDHVKH